MPLATVHPEGDPSFPAQVVELRPNSILLRSDHPLNFRAKVLVEVVGAQLRGEVVFASDGQLAITFPVAPEIFDIIEAVDAELDDEPAEEPAPNVMAAIDDALDSYASTELPALDDAEAITSTIDLRGPGDFEPVPSIEPKPHLVVRDGVLEADDPLEALGLCLLLRSGRSLVATLDGWLPSTVHLLVPEGPVVLEASLAFEGWVTLRARDDVSLKRAIARLREHLDDLEAGPTESEARPASPSTPGEDDPDFGASGDLPSDDLPAVPTDDIATRPLEPISSLSPPPSLDPPPSWDPPVREQDANIGGTGDLVEDETSADVEDFPELLDDDRTVRFRSHAQYVAQYDTNLSKQALVVKMAPIATFATRAFVLSVPGADPVEVLARAVFPNEDTVGFSIERFGSVRPTLEAMARGTPVPPSAEPVMPSVTEAVEGYAGLLGPPEDPRALMNLRADRPKSLEDTGGSYLRTLDVIFGRRLDCVLEVSDPPEVIRAWIQAGRVVFTTRDPHRTEGRLGSRLVSAKSVSQRGLQEALESARTSGKALGSLLIEEGMLRREDLNRALRAQTVDRMVAPVSFTSGTLRIHPWRSPPIQARWFPVSGNALLADAIRERLRGFTAHELESKLFEDLGRSVIVDLSAIEPRYRIREKEHRVYSRAATTPLPLRHLSRFVSAGQVEALRLVVLGCALGFVRLGEVEAKGEPASSAPAAFAGHPARDSTEGLEQRLAELEKADHFEALGVHWTAPHHEIIVAYKRETHLLKKLPRHTDARSRELARRLRDRIELAFKKVGNRSNRIAYRNTAIPADQIKNAGRHLIEQAELAITRERPDDADPHLDMAEELLGPRAVRRLRDAVRELRACF